MRTAYLYRVNPDRSSSFVSAVSVPESVYADIVRNYKTPWLADNGYDSSYYLRAARVIETTPAERQAMFAAERRLKAEGKLPSAAAAIAGKLLAPEMI